ITFNLCYYALTHQELECHVCDRLLGWSPQEEVRKCNHTCISSIINRVGIVGNAYIGQILRVTTPMQINNGIPLHNTYNGLRSSSTPQ
ncbi:hypothetical protein Tsp_10505, partial [Trichinella spiralis]|uniref:hypothetical protein n=1 Tax=Trichinella spiralis TaxID=6334 RepID=UPI0001EFD148